MTIKSTGKLEVIVCDHCAFPCETEVVEVREYRAGYEEQAITQHFCSRICWEEHTGVAEKIAQGIERGTRKEVNTIHSKLLCPKCTERLKRFL